MAMTIGVMSSLLRGMATGWAERELGADLLHARAAAGLPGSTVP